MDKFDISANNILNIKLINMDKLDTNLIYLIFNYLDFLSKIKFRCISKYVHHFIVIDDFKNIPEKYLNLLDDEILINYPFIKYLNACDNKKITNVNHSLRTKLIELDAIFTR
jgi:hypothetical protein